MNKIIKHLLLTFLLLIGVATIAHAKGPVHEAVNTVADFVSDVYAKHPDNVKKASSKLATEAAKGKDSMRHWCGEHKETCGRESTVLASKIIAKELGPIAEEFVKLAPTILELAAVLVA